MISIQPLGNRVLARLTKIEAETESGLILPDMDKLGEMMIAEILFVGPLCSELITVGSKVVFPDGAAEELDIRENGETLKLLLISEPSLKAIIK